MEDHPEYQAGADAKPELEPEHWPTTDELVAMARAHRQGEAYPTPARLLENLPVVMRGLCDYVLSGAADAYHLAYAIASLIEVIFLVERSYFGRSASAGMTPAGLTSMLT